MPRFFLAPEKCNEAEIFLTGSEAHHAIRVLRLQRNDKLFVLDGAGSELHCTIEAYDRDKVQLSVLEKRFVPPLPYQITLLQALPKGKLFEAIVQKATELGTFRVVPLLSERVVSSGITQREKQRKAEKWRTV